MNLDLNLVPLAPASTGILPEMEPIAPSSDEAALNLDEPLQRSFGEIHRYSTRQQWWSRHVLNDSGNQAPRFDNGRGGNGGGAAEDEEESPGVEERSEEEVKTSLKTLVRIAEKQIEKNEDVKKESDQDCSFFDCNICLDMAKEPIVTCCGHLFCWPCIYQWLNIHSAVKECPVCKGEVTVKNITPIYGRGNNERDPGEDLKVEIPIRPRATRYDSVRPTRHTLDDDAFLVHILQYRESYLNRYLRSRGMREEETAVVAPDYVGNLTGRNPHTRTFQLSVAHATAPATRATATRTARNWVQPPLVEDQDSFSSVGGIIQGDGQRIDAAVEIDSTLSLSTSSSRRRSSASRAANVDRGVSRATRRRLI